MKDNIEFIINLGKILSFNEYLKAGIKKGKLGNYAFLYMNPTVREYKTKIKLYIIDNYKELILENRAFFKKTYKYEVNWEYQLTNPGKLDLSNIGKIVEDSIFDAINNVLDLTPLKKKKKKTFDDSQIYKSSSIKSLKTSELELIKVNFHHIK